MNGIRRSLLVLFAVIGLTAAAHAQRDDQKKPPKEKPPVVTPEKKPPRENPPKNQDRPKKPEMSWFFAGRPGDGELA